MKSTHKPTEPMLKAARDMLGVLTDTGRNLTVSDAISISSNVAANAVIATGKLGPQDQWAARMGALTARVQHLISAHVAQVLEDKLGKAALLAFNDARFTATLDCINSMHNTDLVPLSEHEGS